MIDELKSRFIVHFRGARFTLEDEFLSLKMEENTCLETHLVRMHGIHLRLVEDFDYWTMEEYAILQVLRSLPPSYRDFVHDYVGRGESFTFHEFVNKLRSLNVKPTDGEFFDGEGIYDIQIINVFPLYNNCDFNEYLILVLFY